MAIGRLLRLIDANRAARRSIADAVEVLRKQPGFTDDVCAVVKTAPLPVPSFSDVALVQLVCRELGCAVSLPSCQFFWGKQASTAGPERFPISRLNGAKVDADCNVELADSIFLHAVRIEPIYLPERTTDAEWRLAHAAVVFAGAQARCCRPLDAKQLPGVEVLDFSLLHGLKICGLKYFTKTVIDKWKLPYANHQTIANKLARFGVSVERRQRRRQSLA